MLSDGILSCEILGFEFSNCGILNFVNLGRVILGREISNSVILNDSSFRNFVSFVSF